MNRSSLPGFRDFYPPEMAVRTHIVDTWRRAARLYGFDEYDGPPLEPLDLYTEKSGDEIVRQLYNFEDKGGRAVALRPEMTPTLARMVGARAGSLKKPIRWFATPQLFRYERTQRGRLREHFQWNVDIIGEESVAADAEILAVALEALRMLGLGPADVVARFSDRRLLEALLIRAGVPRDRLAVTYAIVDKLTRESVERIRSRLSEEAQLEASTIDMLLRVFTTLDLPALDREFGNDATVAQALSRITEYRQRLEELGFGDYITFDPGIVRGLAYYTGTVFEIFDRKGELRAICGGGRYDRLLASLGGADLPAAGFGMGDVVLTELLRDRGLLTEGTHGVDVFLIAVADAERPVLLELATVLRAAGRSVLYPLHPAGMGRQLKEADARGARLAILLGPDEVGRGTAVLRRMADGHQFEVSLAELRADPLRMIS